MTSKKLILQNSTLSLAVLPLGAKIASLKYHGRELIFLPSQGVIDNYSPQKDQVFDETVAWGGDICAPSVSACTVTIDNYSFEVSDHGNFWATTFTRVPGEELHMEGVTRDFTLRVKFSLKDNVLQRSYEVINNSKYKLPFTFADHLLLPVNKVEFPGVEKMRLEWSYNNLLGKKDDMVNWPLSRTGVFADKLFAKINQPATYHTKDLILTFSSPDLPYVGYWETQGGWPHFAKASRGKNNSYNLGIELTNTDRDNLAEGVKENTVWWIKQGESKKWSIDLEITSS